MPIIPSTTVGFRAGDAVVPFVVGWTAAGVIATELGFFDAQVLLRAALNAKVDLSPAIVASVNALSVVDGTIDIRIRDDLLTRFTLEAAAEAKVSVETAVEASPTLKGVVKAKVKVL
jgi:hypothetical protein